MLDRRIVKSKDAAKNEHVLMAPGDQINLEKLVGAINDTDENKYKQYSTSVGFNVMGHVTTSNHNMYYYIETNTGRDSKGRIISKLTDIRNLPDSNEATDKKRVITQKYKTMLMQWGKKMGDIVFVDPQDVVYFKVQNVIDDYKDGMAQLITNFSYNETGSYFARNIRGNDNIKPLTHKQTSSAIKTGMWQYITGDKSIIKNEDDLEKFFESAIKLNDDYHYTKILPIKIKFPLVEKHDLIDLLKIMRSAVVLNMMSIGRRDGKNSPMNDSKIIKFVYNLFKSDIYEVDPMEEVFARWTTNYTKFSNMASDGNEKSKWVLRKYDGSDNTYYFRDESLIDELLSKMPTNKKFDPNDFEKKMKELFNDFENRMNGDFVIMMTHLFNGIRDSLDKLEITEIYDPLVMSILKSDLGVEYKDNLSGSRSWRDKPIEDNLEFLTVSIDKFKDLASIPGVIKNMRSTPSKFYNIMEKLITYHSNNNGNKSVNDFLQTLKLSVPDPIITFDDNTTLPQNVKIKNAINKAKLYYTLDGTNPSDKSNLYKDPIKIDNPSTLKVVAYNEDMAPSQIIEVKFTNENKPVKSSIPAREKNSFKKVKNDKVQHEDDTNAITSMGKDVSTLYGWVEKNIKGMGEIISQFTDPKLSFTTVIYNNLSVRPNDLLLAIISIICGNLDISKIFPCYDYSGVTDVLKDTYKRLFTTIMKPKNPEVDIDKTIENYIKAFEKEEYDKKNKLIDNLAKNIEETFELKSASFDKYTCSIKMSKFRKPRINKYRTLFNDRSKILYGTIDDMLEDIQELEPMWMTYNAINDVEIYRDVFSWWDKDENMNNSDLPPVGEYSAPEAKIQELSSQKYEVIVNIDNTSKKVDLFVKDGATKIKIDNSNKDDYFFMINPNSKQNPITGAYKILQTDLKSEYMKLNSKTEDEALSDISHKHQMSKKQGMKHTFVAKMKKDNKIKQALDILIKALNDYSAEQKEKNYAMGSNVGRRM